MITIFKECLEIFKGLNKRKLMTRLIMVCAICACVMGGCSYLNKRFGLKDDNPLEEAVEDVIQARTGWYVDLTP